MYFRLEARQCKDGSYIIYEYRAPPNTKPLAKDFSDKRFFCSGHNLKDIVTIIAIAQPPYPKEVLEDLLEKGLKLKPGQKVKTSHAERNYT